MSPVLYSVACIFHALQSLDGAWNRFMDKHGDTICSWTVLCIEHMLACGTAAMGVMRYCCASPLCTHSRFFFQTGKSKAAVSADIEPRSSGLQSNSIFCPTVTGSTLPLPCPICSGPFSTTTGPCSTLSSVRPPVLCSDGPAAGRGGLYFVCPAYLRPSAQPASAYSSVRHPCRDRY